MNSTLTLYRTFADVTASTGVSFSQSNLSVADMDGFKCSNTSAQNSIHLEFNKETGKLVASFKNDVEPVKAGTYKFTATVYYPNGDEEPVALSKQTTISVKVVQEPTFKMTSSTIKLNKYLAADAGSTEAGGTEQGWVATKDDLYKTMTIGDAGYLEITGLVSADGKIRLGDTGVEGLGYYPDETNGIKLGMDSLKHGFKATASLLRSNAKKTTYTLYPVVARNEYDANDPDTYKTTYYTMKTPIKFTVQSHSSKVSVSLSTSGKLDALVEDGAITYTATVKNALYDYSANVDNVAPDSWQMKVQDGRWDISDIQLLDEKGEKTDLFLIEHSETEKKNVFYDTIILKLNPAEEYVANSTYKVKFQYTICNTKVLSSTIKVKVNQSTAKVTASGVSIYQAEQKPICRDINLKLTSPAGAKISEVKLNSKTSKELITALTVPENEWNPNEEAGLFQNGDVKIDEENAILSLAFYTPTALTAGKSYYLYLDVYPYTMAASVKPVTVKVTVKVNK